MHLGTNAWQCPRKAWILFISSQESRAVTAPPLSVLRPQFPQEINLQMIFSKIDTERDRISLRRLAGAAAVVVVCTAIVVGFTLWLCQWSERRLRAIIQPALRSHISRILEPHHYILLNASLL